MHIYKLQHYQTQAARTTHFREMGSRIREMGSVYELKWVVTAKLTHLPLPSKIAHTVLLAPHITR